MGLYDQPEVFKTRHWLFIWILGLAYAALTIAQWSWGYIDFGDGNYMYIAQRIAQGAVVYRDILAPQPPCHLFLGALPVKLAVLCQTEPLYFFRGFSILLHLATFALVMRLAWRAWGRPAAAVLAGAIYLWLPIGYWWSLGYQSEPLEMFFLLAMMAAALRVTAWGDAEAGLWAALAALTNATAAPILLALVVFMLIRSPLRALRMIGPCVTLAAAVVYGFQVWTGGAFLNNVVWNQVGTFPGASLSEFLGYAREKMLAQGGKILAMEGFFLFAALLGFWRYLRRSPLEPLSRLGLGWFCLATLASLFFVTKGGTEDYIFSLSEPAIAVLAAGELVSWARRWQAIDPATETGWISDGIPFLTAKLTATGLLAMFALGPGLNFYEMLWHQLAYELPEHETLIVIHAIKKFSAPDQPILAPPFYAFAAHRRLWEDYSELFIWQMKYWRNREDRNPRGEGWAKALEMAQALRRKLMPIVILELDQTGRFPEVQRALLDAYVPLTSDRLNIFKTLNTHLGFFVPAEGGTVEAADERQRAWRDFADRLVSLYGRQRAREQFAPWCQTVP